MYVLYSFILHVFFSFSLDGADALNQTEEKVTRRNYEDQSEQALALCKSITIFLKPQYVYDDKFQYDLEGLPALEPSLRSSGIRSACITACKDAASDTCSECDCSHSLEKKLKKSCKRACKDEF